MSCNDPISLQALAAEVANLLSAEYIDKNDPKITNGVFVAPSIRGEFLLDPAAKLVFCGMVQACGIVPPPDKLWLDRPTYPNGVLTSYEYGGETRVRWSSPANQAGVPSVLGRTTDGTALKSLLVALESYGLIKDNTLS